MIKVKFTRSFLFKGAHCESGETGEFEGADVSEILRLNSGEVVTDAPPVEPVEPVEAPAAAPKKAK